MTDQELKALGAILKKYEQLTGLIHPINKSSNPKRLMQAISSGSNDYMGKNGKWSFQPDVQLFREIDDLSKKMPNPLPKTFSRQEIEKINKYRK